MTSTHKSTLLVAGAGIALMCLTQSCDDSYNFDDISNEMQLFENGLSAPVGNTTQFYLSEFIPESDLLTVRDNMYALSFNGETSTSFSIPEVTIDPINPSFEEFHIDFLTPIREIPGINEALTATGYTGGPLPETGIEVQGITSATEMHNEPFSIDIPDVPAEIISVSSIRLTDRRQHLHHTTAHRRDAATDKPRIGRFLLRHSGGTAPDPLQNDVIIENGYIHINRHINCTNGSFTEEVPLLFDGATFEPAATRNENNVIELATELTYYGSLNIEDRFDFAGWDPQVAFSVGVESTAISVAEATARIEKELDPVEYTYQVNDLPDFLSNENTCLDLTSITIDLGIDNSTPASVETGMAFRSHFADGSSSPLVETGQPLSISASAQQHIVITNDPAAAGTPGYIADLDQLMYRVPSSIEAQATPAVPATDLTIKPGTAYDIRFQYDILVPITFGSDFRLYYEDAFSDLGLDLGDFSGSALSADLTGEAVARCP